jgi:SAM-dependent methyltransferase
MTAKLSMIINKFLSRAARSTLQIDTKAKMVGMISKSPIMINKHQGETNDEIDRLDLSGSFENPSLWEETLKKAFIEAKFDQDFSAVLKSAWLQENQAEAFSDFSSSSIAISIPNFLNRFGINQTSAVCDLGCGSGHLAYALHKRGFQNVSAMDPNSEWYSGTGYLKSILSSEINIINDFKEWRNITDRFDAIVSKGTIHHWQHIPLVAIDARRTMKPGAFWFAFAEFFANSPREFVTLIKSHPTASRYGSYEWAYPPSVYVDLIQSIGFSLVAVIPYFYRSNELIGSMRQVPSDINIDSLNKIVDDNLCIPGGTVEFFWEEVDLFRRQEHGYRIYTEPQVLVFQRVGI